MKKILASLGLSLFALFASAGFVIAQDLPEKDGIYAVPGRPDLKVRVFVHNPKPDTSTALVCSDSESTSVVSPAGWRLPAGTWNYRLNLSSVPTSVGSVNLPAIADSSYGQWSSAVSGKVTFNRLADTTVSRANSDGQNIIAWGRTQGTALAVTYTWYNRSTGLAVETDTIMNKKFKWSWNACTTSTYDAQNILTHELGHWMGLNDEYSGGFTENTMYGYGATAETKKDTLTVGDILGASALY